MLVSQFRAVIFSCMHACVCVCGGGGGEGGCKEYNIMFYIYNVCVVVGGGGCKEYNIMTYVYILFLRLYVYISVALVKVLCSPLSLRYHAVEMTTILISIIMIPFMSMHTW